MPFIINETGYTDRSVKSLFVWAWNRVRPGLTAGQRAKANYGPLVDFEVKLGRRTYINRHEVHLPPFVNPAWIAIAFWRGRAGLAHPWRGKELVGVKAPKLVNPAPRKPRSTPRRDDLHNALGIADRRLARKAKHLTLLRARKKTAEAEVRTAIRNIEKATIQLAVLGEDAREAREAVVSATNTSDLSHTEFAEKMRAKRQTDPSRAAGRG